MLIIDRTQRIWAALSFVTCAIASGVYVVYATNAINGPSGGSLPGLIFGIIAAAMMVFAGLLAARRRFPSARLGSAQFWLRGHLWIGSLTVPFALFHAGFGWGGRLEQLLWLLFFAVILSGFWGLALQQLLPRMMLEQIPRETFVEQVPHLCLKFTAESDRMLADVCGPLDVTLAPTELKLYQPHLLSHFEEDRKKNRNDYPKTLPESEQFQIFLAKVYSTVARPAVPAPADVAEKKTSQPTPPVVKAVAQVIAPEPEAAISTQSPPTSETALPKPKPDPRALLAAAKARKEQAEAGAVPAVAASEPTAAHPDSASQPASPTTTPSKPDPKALLAAARARKAAAEGAPPSPASESSTPAPAESPAAPVTAKPDPRAMLAAAKAKKEAQSAEAANQPTVPAVDAVSPPPSPDSVAPSAPASGKPDPKAMLAAMKAKKEIASAAAAAPGPAAPVAARPSPLSQLKAVKEPAVEAQSAAPAAKSAPPSASQVKELKQFYLDLIRPLLPLQHPTRTWMETMRRSTLACRIRQDSVHPQFVDIFHRLHDLCEQRRQFAFIQRYHRWLHGWLLIHIPATVALYAILVVHAVTALRVIPFGN